MPPQGQGIVLTAVEWLTVLAVLGLLITIVRTLIGKQAKQLEQRLEAGAQKMLDNEKEVEAVKQNYLKQFTEVRQTITDGNAQNIKEMMSMEMRLKDFLNENFVSDKVCALRHAEIKEIIIKKEVG
jgi:competence protein ComGC